MTAPAALLARNWIGPAMILGGAIAIGFAPIGLRLSDFGPQATAFWRFMFALPMIAAVIYASGVSLGDLPRWRSSRERSLGSTSPSGMPRF
ncbi:MAG: hypothetical protein IPO30_03005 [Hyphomonadaceae bacterium]|nr:hypothetical protein [Hyphomonadaceae bacterium]